MLKGPYTLVPFDQKALNTKTYNQKNITNIRANTVKSFFKKSEQKRIFIKSLLQQFNIDETNKIERNNEIQTVRFELHCRCLKTTWGIRGGVQTDKAGGTPSVDCRWRHNTMVTGC